MSSLLSQIYWVFVLGLDNAGKTSLINFLETGSTDQTSPTYGVGQRQFKVAGKLVSFLDFGGQERFRKNWLNQETWGFARRRAKHKNAATVFVADITETDERWEEATEWFKAVSRGFHTPELIIFTKSDLIESNELPDGKELLTRLKITDPNAHVAFTSTKEGQTINNTFVELIERKSQ
ncbi:MAG: ADP-ribosylation factor-like protein [Candidatus Hodarchaeales archaeon]